MKFKKTLNFWVLILISNFKFLLLYFYISNIINK